MRSSSRFKQTYRTLATIFVVLFVMIGLQTVFRTPRASAEEAPAYAAELVNRSNGTLRLRPGQAATVWADFRNTGTSAWTKKGEHFVALNVTSPIGRASAFRHRFWPSSYRPAKLQTATVLPGEVGRVAFAVQAPMTPGDSTEHFQLVAENLTWIPGGTIDMPITVISPYEGEVVNRAFGSLTLRTNEAVTVWVDIRNTGTATWKNTGKNFIALNVTDPSGRRSSFAHSSWPLSYRPAKLITAEVRPGHIGRVTFALQAPQTPGNYAEAFQLVAENLTWISGTSFSFPITVVSREVPTTSTGEPIMDVGLRSVTDAMTIRGNGAITLTRDGQTLATAANNEQITLSFSAGVYTAQTPAATFSGSTHFTILPADSGTILEVVNMENRPAWNLDLNDNRFRGALRLQYAEATGKIWLINTLPLEQYLRGVAESSNDSPEEFHKALYTAARSYAFYHAQTKTKHAAEHFIVDATYDQVYRGYGFEIRSPRVVAAIQATQGQTVTWNGKSVVTPYFSQSDGRTRSWEEVWGGGPYPWLVSRPDPLCNGKPLLGHGVGMSARGALLMAGEGKNFSEILSYYYSGIVLQAQY